MDNVWLALRVLLRLISKVIKNYNLPDSQPYPCYFKINRQSSEVILPKLDLPKVESMEEELAEPSSEQLGTADIKTG